MNQRIHQMITGFECSICNEKYKTELDLNTHYLFDHNTFRGFCENDKLLKFHLLIDELTLKFNRFTKYKIEKMINRKIEDGYYWRNLTNDEELIYFYVRLMDKYHIPIKRLTEEQRQKILDCKNRISSEWIIMRNHCVRYNEEWEEYFTPTKSEDCEQK